MKKQELYKLLRKYDKNTEIKIWFIDYRNWVYNERKMIPQDIMISHRWYTDKWDGTIIICPLMDAGKDLSINQ